MLRAVSTQVRSKSWSISTNNHRGRGSVPCVFWRDLNNPCHIVSMALLVRVQRSCKDQDKDVQGQSTIPGPPLDDHSVILSTSKALNCFRSGQDKIRCFWLHIFSCKWKGLDSVNRFNNTNLSYSLSGTVCKFYVVHLFLSTQPRQPE